MRTSHLRAVLVVPALAAACIGFTTVSASADSPATYGHCHQYTTYDSAQAPGQNGDGPANPNTGQLPPAMAGSQVCAQA